MLSILILIQFILLSLGQFVVINKSSEINLYLFDIFTGFIALIGIIYYLKIKSFFVPRNVFPFLVFILLGGLSLVINIGNFKGIEVVNSGFYLIRFLTYLCSAVVIANFLKSSNINKKMFTNILNLSGFIILIIGVIQLILLPDLAALDPMLGWDPHKNRLSSSFFDPNFIASYLTLLIIYNLSLFVQNKDKKLLIYAILFFIGVVFTFSRSGWLMLSFTVLLFGLLFNKKAIGLFLIIAFLAYFAVPRIQTRISNTTDPADSARYRVESWRNTWSIAKDNLLTGVGFNTFRYAQKNYGYLSYDSLYSHSGGGSDSSFLLVLATTGVPGLIVFIYGWFSPLLKLSAKINPGTKYLVFSTVVGLFVNSLFINSIFYPQIIILWMVFLLSYP